MVSVTFVFGRNFCNVFGFVFVFGRKGINRLRSVFIVGAVNWKYPTADCRLFRMIKCGCFCLINLFLVYYFSWVLRRQCDILLQRLFLSHARRITCQWTSRPFCAVRCQVLSRCVLQYRTDVIYSTQKRSKLKMNLLNGNNCNFIILNRH